MDEEPIEELAGELPADVEPEEMDFEPVPDEYQPVVRAAMDYAKLLDELEALADEFERNYKKQSNLNNDWKASAWYQALEQLQEVLEDYE